MKKKIISLIVVCALVNTIFVSCGKKDVKESENTTFNSTETETYKMVEKETTIEQKTTTEAPTTTEAQTTEVPTTTEAQTTTEAPTTTEVPTTTEPPTTEVPTTEQATTEDPLAWDPYARAERDNPNYWKMYLYEIVYNEDGTANMRETKLGNPDKSGFMSGETIQKRNEEIWAWLRCIDNKEFQDLLNSNWNYVVSYETIYEYKNMDYSHWDIRDYYICMRDYSQDYKLIKRWHVNDDFELVEGLTLKDAADVEAGIKVFR